MSYRMLFLKTVFLCYVSLFSGQQSVFANFVVHGNSANIKYFPYVGMVTVYCDKKSDEIFTCGSSIISDKIFITTAHCTLCSNLKRKPEIYVYVGNSNFTSGTPVKIDKYEAHPKYDPENLFFYNIALLYAHEGIPIGDNVKPVLLSKEYMKFQNAIIAGWSKKSHEKHAYPEKLQYLPVYFITKKECQERGFSNIGRASGTFCAGHLEGSKYVYGGDSGSGLVVKDKGEDYLVGVVIRTQEEYLPLAVYTNVSFHYDWITKTMDKLLKYKPEEKSMEPYKKGKKKKCNKKKKQTFSDIFRMSEDKNLVIHSRD